MEANDVPLREIFRGWDGYQTSLVRAVVPLSPEQLAYRMAPHTHSVGEIAAHIAFGRLDWFLRMGAPGTEELVTQAAPWWQPWKPVNQAIASDRAEIIRWLELSWGMIETNLSRWTVADLDWTYRQEYGGTAYAVSRQWVIWRVMAHDIHHGGQLSLLLDAQGIAAPDLIDNGGHIVVPPVMEPSGS